MAWVSQEAWRSRGDRPELLFGDAFVERGLNGRLGVPDGCWWAVRIAVEVLDELLCVVDRPSGRLKDEWGQVYAGYPANFFLSSRLDMLLELELAAETSTALEENGVTTAWNGLLNVDLGTRVCGDQVGQASGECRVSRQRDRETVRQRERERGIEHKSTRDRTHNVQRSQNSLLKVGYSSDCDQSCTISTKSHTVASSLFGTKAASDVSICHCRCRCCTHARTHAHTRTHAPRNCSACSRVVGTSVSYRSG